MRIEVKSTAVAERKGVSDAGRPWSIREQQAYAHVLDRDGKPEEYPQKITLRLDEGDQAYPAGEYTLADASFYVGQYGRLTVGTVKLQALAKSVQRSA